jgi:carbon storage regulator
MLCLARRKNETIVIGENGDTVSVTVLEIRGDSVRLGVVADSAVPVDRLEVRKRKQNTGAAMRRLEEVAAKRSREP